MKVIFLDIDGVLNSVTDFLEARHYGHIHNEGIEIISPGKLYLVEHIIGKTDAKIVISSSWREMYSLKELYDMFYIRGFTLPRTSIVGKTEICESDVDHYSRRSIEISKWLDVHDHVESYVILDDEDRFESRHKNNLVTTNMFDGLNMSLADDAVLILGKEGK